MITAYIHYDPDGKPVGLHEAVMFTAAEIDTMTALGSRSGSTTMAVLREGFSGGTLGHAYVSRDKNRHLEAGTYRMTVVLSVQPCRAAGCSMTSTAAPRNASNGFPASTGASPTLPPPGSPRQLTLPRMTAG